MQFTIQQVATSNDTSATTEKTYLLSRDHFLIFQANWKSRKDHAAWEIILYNLVRGLPANRGFTPIKNPSKIISNRDNAWNGYNKALENLRSALRTYTRDHWLSEEKCASANVKNDAALQAKFGMDTLRSTFGEVATSLSKKGHFDVC